MKWLLGYLVLSVSLLGGPVTIATYNLELYVDHTTFGVAPKPAEARKLVRESIRRINPDVIAVQEIGSLSSLLDLKQALKTEGLDFPHYDFVQAYDTHLHLGFLSKLPILKRSPHTNESFLYAGKRFHVARGFAEIDVAAGSGRLTLISAHLKSKRQVGEADQQGLREEEALLLREKIDDAMKRDPRGQLIVLGDLNDDVSSKAIRTILGRGRSKLFDPRPAERNGDTLPNPDPRYEPRRIVWTHYFAREDSYSRLDYILVSPNLRQLLDPSGTYVLAMPNWGGASDHRPVCIRLQLPD